MSRYHDDSTFASNPGGVRLDRARLRRIHPRGFFERLFDGSRVFEAILDEHLRLGDSRAAVVLAESPLRVGAYTDEFDCTCVLKFSGASSERIAALLPELRLGARVLTVNTYRTEQPAAGDLWHGAASYHRYFNFFPVIADIYSSDSAAIAARKAEIQEAEWQRCVDAADEYLRKNAGRCRNGAPWASMRPLDRLA